MRFEFVDPVKLYASLKDEHNPFILEFEKFRESKYTLVSANPTFTLKIGKFGTKIDNDRFSKEMNPFKALKSFKSLPGILVGYIPHDFVHYYLEKDFDEESVFCYYENFFAYDGSTLTFYGKDVEWAKKVVERAKKIDVKSEKISSEILYTDASFEEFVEMVEKAKDYIYAGDAFQIVLSRSYVVKNDADPFKIYLRMREINPSPYMFLVDFDKKIVGTSPETMASIFNGVLKVNPIAGTTARGKNEYEDLILAKEMLSSEKEIAEHVMLVDLARNDVRKVCKTGTVEVTRFMDVLKYSHVQHIESEVVGKIEDDKDCFDAAEAAFPAGTLIGAPKLRAIEIIDEIEKSKRRIYGGCVGYFLNSSAEMAIAIRMVEIDKNCEVRAGAGVVADSKAENEFIETERKMAAVLLALGVKDDSSY
ncbi:MAG: anthranilate synthase component I [Archaeoglobaceae archaeon]|nr:anthranilate synthase component I [Archaeoglobaceae archaeon]MCX8152673.1 anthranilate synthase component I [Archaeoglobaceae archaeon]MDW8013674.1 anthranilate synthase component I [Archaeoglobaceae archaeon]